MPLSRDDILKADDIETVTVEVNEWGGEVLVRGLTGRQRDDFEASIMERRGRQMVTNTANVRAKLVSQCCVDVDGKPLFTRADVQALGEKSAGALDRVYEVAAKLSGMTDEDVEKLVEEFDKDPSSGSASSSPGS